MGSGAFSATAGNYGYGALIDVNLDPRFGADVIATAQNQGEEAVTVPAGTFTCTKTLYDKDKGNGARVNITLWTNGQAGLVKAQVSNVASLGTATFTADIRYDLEKRP